MSYVDIRTVTEKKYMGEWNLVSWKPNVLKKPNNFCNRSEYNAVLRKEDTVA